jgi:hypothetical protein
VPGESQTEEKGKRRAAMKLPPTTCGPSLLSANLQYQIKVPKIEGWSCYFQSWRTPHSAAQVMGIWLHPSRRKLFGLINWVTSPTLPGGGKGAMTGSSVWASLYKERASAQTSQVWAQSVGNNNSFDHLLRSLLVSWNWLPSQRKAFGQTVWATATRLSWWVGKAGNCF